MITNEQRLYPNLFGMSDRRARLTVTYKILFLALLLVFVCLVLARVVMAVVCKDPSVEIQECMRDLSRWAGYILAGLLGALGGRAAK